MTNKHIQFCNTYAFITSTRQDVIRPFGEHNINYVWRELGMQHCENTFEQNKKYF